MEKSGNSPLGPRLRGSVFSVRTQSRTYHLEADCEDDMEKWVHAICQVCNLRSTDDTANREMEVYQPAAPPVYYPPRAHSSTPSPYIPISECITGLRHRNEMETSFAGKKSRHRPIRTRHCAYLSENESNVSDEDFKSIPSAHPVGDWTVTKSFKKLKIRNHDLGPVRFPGPPVPPRPWATLGKSRDEGNEIATISSSKLEVPVEVYVNKGACAFRKPCCQPVASDDAPARPQRQCQKALMGDHTYTNLERPPIIDRALKPRFPNDDENKEHVLQYLDLDLHSSSSSSTSNDQHPIRIHGRIGTFKRDDECEYNTVDFIKTEAFMLTRQDIEASRSRQCIINQ